MKKILLSVLVALISTFHSYTIFAQSQPQTDTELTLKEAYQLGLSIAKKWDSRVTLGQMGSIDDNKIGSKGADGKRRKWGLMFFVPGERKSVAMYIHDKKNTVFVTSKSTIKSDFLISSRDVVLDSPAILQMVKSKFNLKPGKNWAVGYHFLLYRWNGKTVMGVLGLDNEGKMTNIFVDAKTGEFLQFLPESRG
ncbi:hypothetical protein [Brevibacillus choshinensis]|uniref:PepSY domain-containing protein n=1 Tax=Brevibacillus choshinensis TaxID=54911 RepID=A0ABX7FNV5_BRECH|nr:hypothetical protein [Brevibacillus choshinensis]QRG66670.1 hypothetical protein JNE38_24680 [Brevibacillus choshinensis]